MFNFAFKTATEGMVVDNPASTAETTTGSNLSEGAVNMARHSCIYGLVCAFARKMAMAGVDKEAITEGISKLLDAARSAGDLSENDCKWLMQTDWYTSASENLPISVHCCSSSLFEYEDDIIEDACCVRTWATGYIKQAAVTENERAILKNFDDARKAFWEARRIRDQYFRKEVIGLAHSIVLKYGEILRVLDGELYTYISGRFEASAKTEGSIIEKVVADGNKTTSSDDDGVEAGQAS